MFEDVGEKIQDIAKFLFVLCVIGSIILACTLGWEKKVMPDISGYSYYSSKYVEGKEFKPVVFFSILVLGPLYAYVQSLLLVGFGELIKRAEETSNNTQKCLDSISAIDSNTFTRINDIFSVQKGKEINDPEEQISFERVEADGVVLEKTKEVSNKKIDNMDCDAVEPLKAEQEGLVICPKCGTVQKAGRYLCWHCAMPFITDN